jgi:hypothetical protein
MRKILGKTLCPILVLCASIKLASGAAPHRYDHVVIVMEENRTPSEIIGDLVNAPYINSLATNGVRMGRMFAITHPSQPNYIELFSGTNMGIINNDDLPTNFSTTVTSTYPFSSLNLGAEIVAAGFSFAGFCEDLETAGTNDWADFDPHTASGLEYRRRHNPWANWIAKLSPVPANQLASTVNRAFTQFPTDYSQLPTVSFVVPNLEHDMHDGSRKDGDGWLKTNLNAYAQWATTNNSLLIITWDEDDYNSINQIPTVFYGAGLRNGAIVNGTWTLHNLLRTIEEMYGSTTHAGAAAQVRRIVGPFADDPAVTNVTFQQGLNGYSGARDTQILAASPNSSFAATDLLNADLDTSGTSGNQEAQGLVRFDAIFGNGAGQVPTNAIIQSAKLIVYTPTNSGSTSPDTFAAHRMIVNWNDTDTWNSLGNGVSADNIEAASASSFAVMPLKDDMPVIIDVTGDVELFRNGVTNCGWLIRASSSAGGDSWNFNSSEVTVQSHRPALEVVYSLPTPYSIWAATKGLSTANNDPTTDPDHDGASNLAEFAYNLNPLAPDARPLAPGGTNGLPLVRFLPGVSGGVMEMEFVRRKGTTAAGLTYTAQFSDDFDTAWINGQTPVVTSLNPDWDRIVVRDATPGPKPRRFGKVTLALQP